MRFLQTHPRGLGSAYELLAIEAELERRGFTPMKTGQGSGKALRLTSSIAGRLCLSALLHPCPAEAVLLVHGGVPDSLTFPRAFWTRFIPYSFDCWSPEWPRWESFYRRSRAQLAILTARQCAEHFQSLFPAARFLWLPECIDPSLYDRGALLEDRHIDLLELGRRFDRFHDAVQPLLQQAHRSHLYERTKGEVIFPTRELLVSAYADTKISACFPSSVTHPERSGRVETLTFRYLEAMASRTLIVGKCPAELSDLFGYNPVVEPGKPADVLDILRAIPSYQPLVDRNYQRLLETGTHTVRVAQLITALRTYGYSAP